MGSEDEDDQVLEEHRKVCVPEPVCRRCLTGWPCLIVLQERTRRSASARPRGDRTSDA
jgi:hypothetical protein